MTERKVLKTDNTAVALTNGVVDGAVQGTAGLIRQLGRLPVQYEDGTNPFTDLANKMHNATLVNPYEGNAYETGLWLGQQVPSTIVSRRLGNNIYTDIFSAIAEGNGMAKNNNQPYDVPEATFDVVGAVGSHEFQRAVGKYLGEMMRRAEFDRIINGPSQTRHAASGEREEQEPEYTRR